MIRRPTTDPFTLTQHITALSMRNKQDYLERIRAATPIIEELVKVKPSTWRQVKGLFTSIESVGRMNMLGNFTGRMQQAAMFPMNVAMNRAEFMVEQLFMPLLPIVNRVASAYENFVMSNSTGALIGGGIGLIVGGLIGHPFLGALVGGGIGALAESFWWIGKGGTSTTYDILERAGYSSQDIFEMTAGGLIPLEEAFPDVFTRVKDPIPHISAYMRYGEAGGRYAR